VKKKIALRRAVFLDRDGVLNRALVRDGKPYPPRSVKEVKILPGVRGALRKLKGAGFLLICVTNQPDVARKKLSRKTVEAIHSFLLKTLCLDEIMACYHDDKDKCRCRKPLPGMLLDAAKKYSIDLGKSFMAGDRWRDIAAGKNAGCATVLVDYHYAEKKSVRPDARAGSLAEAAEWILSRK